MNNANNLVGEPIGTGALENEFKEAVAEGTEHEHDTDAKTKHGIDAPVDQGHKEQIKGFITQEGDGSPNGLQSFHEGLDRFDDRQFKIVNHKIAPF